MKIFVKFLISMWLIFSMLIQDLKLSCFVLSCVVDLGDTLIRVATGVDISTNVSIYRLKLKLVDNFVDNINTLNQLKYINN